MSLCKLFAWHSFFGLIWAPEPLHSIYVYIYICHSVIVRYLNYSRVTVHLPNWCIPKHTRFDVHACEWAILSSVKICIGAWYMHSFMNHRLVLKFETLTSDTIYFVRYFDILWMLITSILIEFLTRLYQLMQCKRNHFLFCDAELHVAAIKYNISVAISIWPAQSCMNVIILNKIFLWYSEIWCSLCQNNFTGIHHKINYSTWIDMYTHACTLHMVHMPF